MAKTTPAGRIGQQVGVKPRATITPAIQSEIKKAAVVKKPTAKVIKKQVVDYDRAWETAKKHWSKGKAGAYLYFMRRGEDGPQQAAVYDYVKYLDKQTRAGNISPGRSKGSLLAAEEYRASIAPKPTPVEKPAPFIGPIEPDRTLPTPPPLEVQPAPTWSEKYSSAIKESGYIKGTLAFVGGTAASLRWKAQEIGVKKYGGRYDPYTAELFGKGVEVAPYFTPYAGPALLIAGGAEEFITPSGRERISTQSEYLESKGWSPTWAKTGAIALPVGEVALGVFGAKAGLKKWKIGRDVKRTETAFTAIETPTRRPGLTEVRVISETTIGKQTIPAVSRQFVIEDIKGIKDLSFGVTTGMQFPTAQFRVIPGESRMTLALIKPTTRWGRFFPTTRPAPGGAAPTYPFVSVGYGREIGAGRIFRSTADKQFMVSSPAGRGVLGKTFGQAMTPRGAVSFEQQMVGTFRDIPGTRFALFRGGVPSKLRVYPEKLAYTTPGRIRGVLFKAKPRPEPFKVSVGSLGKPSLVLKKSVQRQIAIEKSVMAQVSQMSGAGKALVVSQIKTFPSIVSGGAQVLKQAPRFKQQLTMPQIVKPVQIQEVKQRGAIKTITTQITKLAETTKQKRGFLVAQTPRITQKSFVRQRTASISLSKQLMRTRAGSPRAMLASLRGGEKPLGLLWSPPLRMPTPLWLAGAKSKGSFIPQVMHKGKWKTVGKRMDRNSALSRASRGADLSTSRRMRILPSKKAPQVTSILGWGIRKHKFRPYRKVKGRRVALHNTWIEKTTHAIDTPSEKLGLSIARVSKNMGWLAGIKKSKKKKSKSQWFF